MDKLEKAISFVKDLIVAQENMAEKYKDQSYRASKHEATAYKCKELLDYLTEIKRGPDISEQSGKTSNAKRMSLSLEDIEDLPAELIAELNISDTDKQDLIVEDIIKKAGGVQSLDRIIVELYRRTGEIIKRNTLTSRLYRMVQRRVIFNVPGKKGLYSTQDISEAEVRKLFGEADIESADSG